MEAWVHSGAFYGAAGPAMGTGRQGGGTWMDVSQVTQVSAQKPRKRVAVSPCLLGQAPARRWGQMSARSAASSRALRWWEAAAQKEASQAEDREAGVGPSAGADCLPRGTRDDQAALSAPGMVLSRDLVEGISISV